ncbi:signal peptide protein [Afipia sp. P52-10]|uniref:hypothetical protein n=1 Tax=Afipia sp. P52-10 TaxID=1429916 RepID=UPI0003DF22B4|nr:hypothetical protein [Afipia sp. P52-10]ETR75538.1 signal peptide protein [Afipia sp. P52-10]
MRAAGPILACAAIAGGIAAGYFAMGLDGFPWLEFAGRTEISQTEAAYPSSNRENKRDRLHLDLPQLTSDPLLFSRGDSLRQSYAAADSINALPQPLGDPQPLTEPPPIPRPRPKGSILRRQQSSYTLLSDLQIDAIKTRLKLTPAQEKSWPAVETALRTLAVRLHEAKKSGGASDLRPDSAEFVQLKAAAGPFFAQLSAEQKRELRMLAHIIGLGSVMAQL